MGRILTSDERLARMQDEDARSIAGEVRRTAFAISDSHLLTAWHCVREPLRSHAHLWFRLRDDRASERAYLYVPVRVSNYDERLDVAALAIDPARIHEAELTPAEATAILRAAAIRLSTRASAGDRVLVIGFPETAPSADSDSNSAEIADDALPLGDTVALKLYCPALAAADPVRPGGLSGGPVLVSAPRAYGTVSTATGLIRAAPRGSLPGVAAGGGLVASRVADIATRLPEVALTLQPSNGARLPSASLLDIFAGSYRALQETMSHFADPVLGSLTGWSHFLNESRSNPRPTPFGTAYGLKLVLSLDYRDGLIDRSALAETLWKLRKPDGGWAARTQAGVGRAEATALAAGALAAAGYDSSRVAEAAAVLEGLISPESDAVGVTRTYVVSSVIRGLLRAAPASQRLPELRAALLAGAMKDPDRQGLICWSDRFVGRRIQAPAPSVAHTAHAVVALARASQVLGPDAAAEAAVEQAVRWLSLSGRLRNQVEQIRRYIADDRSDPLTVNHFTAAWVAEAILATSPASMAEAGPLLAEAIRRVIVAQRDGIWKWDNNDRPIWMTYQGLRVLKENTLRNTSPQ